MNYLPAQQVTEADQGSIGIFWLVQKRYTIRTKTMLLFVSDF